MHQRRARRYGKVTTIRSKEFSIELAVKGKVEMMKIRDGLVFILYMFIFCYPYCTVAPSKGVIKRSFKFPSLLAENRDPAERLRAALEEDFYFAKRSREDLTPLLSYLLNNEDKAKELMIETFPDPVVADYLASQRISAVLPVLFFAFDLMGDLCMYKDAEYIGKPGLKNQERFLPRKFMSSGRVFNSALEGVMFGPKDAMIKLLKSALDHALTSNLIKENEQKYLSWYFRCLPEKRMVQLRKIRFLMRFNAVVSGVLSASFFVPLILKKLSTRNSAFATELVNDEKKEIAFYQSVLSMREAQSREQDTSQAPSLSLMIRYGVIALSFYTSYLTRRFIKGVLPEAKQAWRTHVKNRQLNCEAQH